MSGVSLQEYSFERETPLLSKGDYIVIDPCYVLGEDPFWDDFIDFSFSGEGPHDPTSVVRSGGRAAFIFDTAHGDGVYPVRKDGVPVERVGVDAGLLSLIPVEMLEENDAMKYVGDLGARVTLDIDAYPMYDEGNVTCDNIKVITATEDDEGEYIWGSSPDDEEDW